MSFSSSDGTTIKTRLVVVSKAIPEKTDAIYEFRSRDSAVSNEGGSGERIGAALSELELMRAMLRGDEVSGYDIKNVSRSLFPGFSGVPPDLSLHRQSIQRLHFELANTTRKLPEVPH